MTAAAFSAAASDVALDALFVPFHTGALRLPADGRVLFLRARDGFALREMAKPGWLCEQTFKPFADALEGSRISVGSPEPGALFSLVLLLPPRQREEARALFARALTLLAPGGQVVACMANSEGGKSGESDLAQLVGSIGSLSKHKCRVFWSVPEATRPDTTLCDAWLALDAPRANAAGFISRPGLFAWDRVDAASALLAEHLPPDLAGRVADIGAGYGYLSTQLLVRCAGVTSLDLFEAEARALEPARGNVEAAMHQRMSRIPFAVHWHDVTDGLPGRYDVIVSNPPFHQGKADLPELGRAFIRVAADALTPQGRFWLVANRHLPYEAILAERFQEVRQIVLQDGFKVIEARGPRR